MVTRLYGLPMRQFAIGLTAPEIADDLNQTGVVCLERVIPADWLERAKNHASSLLVANGGRDLTVRGLSDELDSPAYELIADENFKQLLDELTLGACPEGVADGEEIYSVLRVVAGSKPVDEPLYFHYDASVVTVIVPICMPQNGGGELVLFPNRRPIRRSVGLNIIEKLVTQNGFYRARFARRLENQDQQDKCVVGLEQGNAYLFWGYRTYHAPLPPPPGELRVTLCLHYGQPHGRHPALTVAAHARDLWLKLHGD